MNIGIAQPIRFLIALLGTTTQTDGQSLVL